MTHEEIFDTVQLTLANILRIQLVEITRGSDLVTLGCTPTKQQMVLERLAVHHGIRLNLETGMEQKTVQGLCNYVVCQLLPKKPVVQKSNKRRSIHTWVI
ncbi:MAG TPA: hypothetical protein VLG69_04685 [Candidatus Andersenbacteria bacterium]|nr:hypothetical protein [Candidatus Andersenbacteria bacterium]